MGATVRPDQTEASLTAVDARIRGLEDRRYAAILERDFETFIDLCDQRLSYTHSNGVRDTLDSYVAECRNETYVYHAIEHPIDHVIVLRDAAIVVGKMKAELSVHGVRKQLDNQSLALWVRVDDEEWKLLAFQGTPIPATS